MNYIAYGIIFTAFVAGLGVLAGHGRYKYTYDELRRKHMIYGALMGIFCSLCIIVGICSIVIPAQKSLDAGPCECGGRYRAGIVVAEGRKYVCTKCGDSFIIEED